MSPLETIASAFSQSAASPRRNIAPALDLVIYPQQVSVAINFRPRGQSAHTRAVHGLFLGNLFLSSRNFSSLNFNIQREDVEVYARECVEKGVAKKQAIG